jgi:hypothetical protein
VTEAAASPVTLTVVPVLAEGDTTLNDIRPQARLDLPANWTVLIAGLVLATVFAGGGLWLYRRWRSKSPAVIDNRSPDQVAIDELARIDGLRLPAEGRFKEHYTLVTDCLRTYIERQFYVHAFDRTTSELKLSLSQSKMSPEHSRLFIDLFSDSDLVKFAKLRPALEEANQLTTRARTLVEVTKPRLAEEQPGAATSSSEPTNFQTPAEVTQ